MVEVAGVAIVFVIRVEVGVVVLVVVGLMLLLMAVAVMENILRRRLTARGIRRNCGR